MRIRSFSLGIAALSLLASLGAIPYSAKSSMKGGFQFESLVLLRQPDSTYRLFTTLIGPNPCVVPDQNIDGAPPTPKPVPSKKDHPVTLRFKRLEQKKCSQHTVFWNLVMDGIKQRTGQLAVHAYVSVGDEVMVDRSVRFSGAEPASLWPEEALKKLSAQ